MADLIDREEIDAVIACLGDDAAQLRADNPDDERADNMDRAATLLQQIADDNSAIARTLLDQDREGAKGWARGIHLNMDSSGGLTASAPTQPVAWRWRRLPLIKKWQYVDGAFSDAVEMSSGGAYEVEYLAVVPRVVMGDGTGEALPPVSNEERVAPGAEAHRWISLAERKPEPGALIVKRWKSGSVWAGVYSGSDKDSSFDEWVALPDGVATDQQEQTK